MVSGWVIAPTNCPVRGKIHWSLPLQQHHIYNDNDHNEVGLCSTQWSVTDPWDVLSQKENDWDNGTYNFNIEPAVMAALKMQNYGMDIPEYESNDPWLESALDQILQDNDVEPNSTIGTNATTNTNTNINGETTSLDTIGHEIARLVRCQEDPYLLLQTTNIDQSDDEPYNMDTNKNKIMYEDSFMDECEILEDQDFNKDFSASHESVQLIPLSGTEEIAVWIKDGRFGKTLFQRGCIRNIGFPALTILLWFLLFTFRCF